MTKYERLDNGSLNMNTSFYYQKIWVLESLRDGDIKTGTRLFDEVLMPLLVKNHKLEIKLKIFEDKVELFEILNEIYDDYILTSSIPLIHFETHGQKIGLETKSNELVRFEEMLPQLRKLNVSTKNNLFIVVAACYGEYLSFILRKSLNSHCPFWGVLGPEKAIEDTDLLKGYSAFYNQLLISDVNQALDGLRNAIPQSGNSFHLNNSEYLFLKAFKTYQSNLCTSDEIDKRIDDIERITGKLTHLQKEEIKETLSSKEDQKNKFERMRRIFFMHDKIEDINDLPNPSFENMMAIKVT